MAPGSVSSRYIKIHEFCAHQNSQVNCVSIGRKSTGVLVTGGDDKRVNLWTIGTQSMTMSLSGHLHPVCSVAFDDAEQVVAAGASSGNIKLFDLDSVKVIRSLAGHKTTVLCLDWSTQQLASGSEDTNVKVWDGRQKEATQVLKGHSAPVTRVRLSPDGNLVCSGDKSGVVKVFDLRGNRYILDQASHTHPVTGLELHPYEYAMISSSTDKTAKAWELDTEIGPDLLGTTPIETSAVRAVAFHSGGQHYFSATQDGLKVWKWGTSPQVQHDFVEIPWYKVSDISVANDRNRLYACSFDKSFVGMWMVELNKVRPWQDQGVGDSGAYNDPRRPSASTAALPSQPRGGSGASNGAARVSGSGAARPTTSPALSNNANMGDCLRRHGQNSAAAAMIGRPTSPINRQLEPVFQALQMRAPQEAPKLRPSSRQREPESRQSAGNGEWGNADNNPSQPIPQPARRAAPVLVAAPPAKVSVSVGVGVGDSLARNGVDPGVLLSLAQQAAQASGQRLLYPPSANPYSRGGVQGQGAQAQGAGPAQYPFAGMQPPLAGAGAGHNAGRPGSSGPGQQSGKAALEDAVREGHKVFAQLNQQGQGVHVMRSLLLKGDLKGALASARRFKHPQPAADVLEALSRRRGFGDMLSLDVLPELVPVLESILQLPGPNEIQVAIDMGLLVCKAFAPTIREVCSPEARRGGVDISYDQRKAKCEAARMVLQNMSIQLAATLRRQQGGTLLSARGAELIEHLAML